MVKSKRRNNALKPRVQTRRKRHFKKTIRRKRPSRSKSLRRRRGKRVRKTKRNQAGGEEGVSAVAPPVPMKSAEKKKIMDAVAPPVPMKSAEKKKIMDAVAPPLPLKSAQKKIISDFFSHIKDFLEEKKNKRGEGKYFSVSDIIKYIESGGKYKTNYQGDFLGIKQQREYNSKNMLIEPGDQIKISDKLLEAEFTRPDNIFQTESLEIRCTFTGPHFNCAFFFNKSITEIARLEISLNPPLQAFLANINTKYLEDSGKSFSEESGKSFSVDEIINHISSKYESENDPATNVGLEKLEPEECMKKMTPSPSGVKHIGYNHIEFAFSYVGSSDTHSLRITCTNIREENFMVQFVVDGGSPIAKLQLKLN